MRATDVHLRQDLTKVDLKKQDSGAGGLASLTKKEILSSVHTCVIR